MSQASATASSAPNKIHFWFEFASTYSYLSAARVAKVGKAANVEIVWEPFLLGPIFQQQGWTDSPFNLYEQKGRYMWRDMERLCDGYGLPFRRPDKFPMNSLLATRVAMLGRGEEWLPDFARALYHANFADGQDIADPATLERILAALALHPEDLIARADSDENKRQLREQTERAAQLKIFGAPTFSIEEELFWGNDRLGDAVVWARSGGSR
ncbi:MAG: 2-hydroxychromene-2-carboxylate isomerase [Myxococcota bacterium]|jgi:2-hydroxychromene-2-carboxylate isomerase